MDQEFGISARDVEAAEAETARKLAADRAVDLESPALRTYVSQNPDADMTLLKFVDEMKTTDEFHCVFANLHSAQFLAPS